MPSDFSNPEQPDAPEPQPEQGLALEPSDTAHQQTNDSEDRLSFLHPTSLVFELLAHIKSYLVPAAIGLFGAAKGDLVYIIISAVIFIPAFLTCIFRYFTLRYCIKDDHLIVTQGLIFRNVRTVPVNRIQNIDFVQNPFHRIFKVAEVKIETASGTKPEATLRVLSMAKMDELRQAVFGKANQIQATNENLTPSFVPSIATDSLTNAAPNPPASLISGVDETAEKTLLQIPLSWLFRAGAASNRGMLMFGVAFGLYIQFGGDRQNLNFQWLRNLLPENTPITWIVLGLIAASIVGFLLLRLLGVGWYILRFFGYKLVRRGEDLRISCGLFTKVSATIPRKRVQFISIQHNLILRWLGFTSIRIETAGGAGGKGEAASESVSKRWFIPVIPIAKVPEILAVLRPELEWDESQLEFQPMAKRASTRLCRLAVMQAILFSAVGLFFWRPWGWSVGVVAIPFLIFWAIKKSRAMRYARTENGVVYRSGVFTKKTSMTFFEKIQVLSVDQNPFDRRWKMAKLIVDTAAAGQAEHRIHVPYLDEEFARNELRLLRIKTGEEQPVFG